MFTIIDFKPDFTGREFIVTGHFDQLEEVSCDVYPQVGWLIVADFEGDRSVVPGVFDAAAGEVLPALAVLDRHRVAMFNGRVGSHWFDPRSTENSPEAAAR